MVTFAMGMFYNIDNGENLFEYLYYLIERGDAENVYYVIHKYLFAEVENKVCLKSLGGVI